MLDARDKAATSTATVGATDANDDEAMWWDESNDDDPYEDGWGDERPRRPRTPWDRSVRFGRAGARSGRDADATRATPGLAVEMEMEGDADPYDVVQDDDGAVGAGDAHDIRRALGLDDASGYHIVPLDQDGDVDGDETGGDAEFARSDARAGTSGLPHQPTVARRTSTAWDIAVADVDADADVQANEARVDGVATARGQDRYPCLEGPRYSGCVGTACPLDLCWTGGITVGLAYRLSLRTPLSTTIYRPGAPCHECSHVQQDDTARSIDGGGKSSAARDYGSTRSHCRRS